MDELVIHFVSFSLASHTNSPHKGFLSWRGSGLTLTLYDYIIYSFCKWILQNAVVKCCYAFSFYEICCFPCFWLYWNVLNRIWLNTIHSTYGCSVTQIPLTYKAEPTVVIHVQHATLCKITRDSQTPAFLFSPANHHAAPWSGAARHKGLEGAQVKHCRGQHGVVEERKMRRASLLIQCTCFTLSVQDFLSALF